MEEAYSSNLVTNCIRLHTYLSSTGKRECGKEWQSEKKALLPLLLLPLGIIVLCSSIVRPALAKISVVRLLLLLRSLIRSNIEPKASRPPSVASTAAARGVIRARNVLLPMGHKSSRAGHCKAALATMHGVLEEELGWGG